MRESWTIDPREMAESFLYGGKATIPMKTRGRAKMVLNVLSYSSDISLASRKISGNILLLKMSNSLKSPQNKATVKTTTKIAKTAKTTLYYVCKCVIAIFS